jgi:hypothetical protein
VGLKGREGRKLLLGESKAVAFQQSEEEKPRVAVKEGVDGKPPLPGRTNESGMREE